MRVRIENQTVAAGDALNRNEITVLRLRVNDGGELRNRLETFGLRFAKLRIVSVTITIAVAAKTYGAISVRRIHKKTSVAIEPTKMIAPMVARSPITASVLAELCASRAKSAIAIATATIVSG